MVWRGALLSFCICAVACASAQALSYNETLAYEALHFAKVASCNSLDEIRSWTCPVCHAASPDFETYWAHESDSDIQGFVGFDKSRRQIVVAFRGSKTLANWIANLKFARVDSPFKECYNCHVHKGFLDDYNSIAEQLFNAVNEIRAKTGVTRVLVTGHSLGAVLALFTAIDLVVHDGMTQPVLYAFGLPRVGNEGALLWGVGFDFCRDLSFNCIVAALTAHVQSLKSLRIRGRQDSALCTRTTLCHSCRRRATLASCSTSTTLPLKCGTAPASTTRYHSPLLRVSALLTNFAFDKCNTGCLYIYI